MKINGFKNRPVQRNSHSQYPNSCCRALLTATSRIRSLPLSSPAGSSTKAELIKNETRLWAIVEKQGRKTVRETKQHGFRHRVHGELGAVLTCTCFWTTPGVWSASALLPDFIVQLRDKCRMGVHLRRPRHLVCRQHTIYVYIGLLGWRQSEVFNRFNQENFPGAAYIGFKERAQGVTLL